MLCADTLEVQNMAVSSQRRQLILFRKSGIFCLPVRSESGPVREKY
jgi:hypothetical protein